MAPYSSRHPHVTGVSGVIAAGAVAEGIVAPGWETIPVAVAASLLFLALLLGWER